MAVGRTQTASNALFFCTFTCWDWIPLIDRTGLYDVIQERLNRLTEKGCLTAGYVIMPNHVHLLLYVPEGMSINIILGDCKRWFAHKIIERLGTQQDHNLLFRVQRDVKSPAYAKGQLHRVWIPSSDIKHCYSPKMIVQKLSYIHLNPVRGKWSLADDPASYPYSSAAFYEYGTAGHVRMTRWEDLDP